METTEEIANLKIKILNLEEKIKRLENDMELIRTWAPDIWNEPKKIGSTSNRG